MGKKKATTWRQAQKHLPKALQGKSIGEVLDSRLAHFCSQFEITGAGEGMPMPVEVGGALLKLRAQLIASGDAPGVWCNRSPFSSELTVLLANLQELFNGDTPRAAQELLRAMKETNCDVQVKKDYPNCHRALHLIAADDAKGTAALAAQCKAKLEAA